MKDGVILATGENVNEALFESQILGPKMQKMRDG